MTLSRRRLLLAGLPALLAARSLPAGARQGLEQFALGGPPCAPGATVTPAVPRDGTYRPGSPNRSSLVVDGASGTPLIFSGTVTGLTCGRIAGARVEVWHADSRGLYDASGWRNRGHQLTGEQGQFRFRTTVPGASDSRAPHLGVHVVVAGRVDFSTELFFPGDPRNAADPRFQPALQLTVLAERAGQTASFDLVLDV